MVVVVVVCVIPDARMRALLEGRVVYDKSKDGGHSLCMASPVPRWFVRGRPPRAEHILVGCRRTSVAGRI